jgi:hypothetical protein
MDPHLFIETYVIGTTPQNRATCLFAVRCHIVFLWRETKKMREINSTYFFGETHRVAKAFL